MARPNKNAPPGEGGRFAYLTGKLRARGVSEDRAKAIAATIGRRKYGKKRFQAMAAKGRADARKGRRS